MQHILKNKQLTVTVDEYGAEVVSVRRGTCEYLWQADPVFWGNHSPLLFPICGRLFEGKYDYEGQTYEMNLHGFARHADFTFVGGGADFLNFRLSSSPELRRQYPFDFCLNVEYRLAGDTLRLRAEIVNTGDVTLPATFGGHPGFNVPLDGGEFTDYVIEFSEECSPDQILFSDACLNTGRRRALPPVKGKTLALRHDLFDHDAIFMSRVANRVTLKSEKSARSVSLYYPDMPYLGLWHKPRTQAPYVCIEPWCGLPAYDGERDDLAVKNDLFRIPAGSSKQVMFEMSFR